MTNIHTILNKIRALSLSEKDKGTMFERLIKLWFLTDPRYNMLTDVWLWEEFPERKELGGSDLGIDLVAKTEEGKYWAIQCKMYGDNTTVDKAKVDSFLANASRTFTDLNSGETKEFSNLVWVQPDYSKWGKNAQQALIGLSKPFNRINLADLETSAVDWDKLFGGMQGKDARISGKQPREHQRVAIEKAHKYFVDEGHDRGKLIMACGTGKTFTSLRIMEDITEERALILFLVPSIALLGQTLNAWMADKTKPIKAICICSDSKVTRKMIDDDQEDESIVDLAVPASTNVNSALRQLWRYSKEDCRTVIFSTYQSIDVVSAVLHEAGKTVDLCICDEAHRTAAYKVKDMQEPAFMKVHSDDNIPARRRLYMTATPRLYRESVKVKAAESDTVICSMDDDNIYGKEFYRLSFNEAVSKGLLTDYKVLVLTVSEDEIPTAISNDIKAKQAAAAEKFRELNFDDATKLIGCINGLSKRIKGDGGITRQQDPLTMRRAVAFCQTINPTKRNPTASSTQVARYFGAVAEAYRQSLPEEDRQDVVEVSAQHVDGSMDANTRNEKIAWLKAETDNPQECRVLCNVRCLSEGVDVPALDAVLFLSPRNSEVEVVQSVGRIMRTFGRGTDHEKKYGYIIIPIVVPADQKPEDTLNDNERFKVVWTILNALRSHDENFNAHVNQINLNKRRDPKIIVGGIPKGQHNIGQGAAEGGDDDAVTMSDGDIAKQLELRFGTLQDGIYARIVEKVGDKMYWENWSKQIGQIALRFIERINRLVQENEQAKEYFGKYLSELQENINPSVDKEQGIEMLAQHMITKPIFDALFKDYQFVNNNAVSRSMEKMILLLEKEGFEMDTEVLDKFYTSVRNNVSSIDNLEGKQTIIKNIYEKFFKGAFPKTVEKLGIVYTPVECVDFILRSVDAILKKEFNTALTNKNVHFLDPFTGTGTFVTRLLQLGVIKREDMERKYLHEIHCNEIVLLAYYIADVNIESVYQDVMHPQEYLPFDGICLTDTFQMSEAPVQTQAFDKVMEDNLRHVQEQMKIPVQVICSNPPYSVGQKSANDNAQNQKYEHLDKRVEETYAKHSTANLGKALYDSYVKAFRWASDRISSNENGGIVAFISNGAWLDGNALDGMRYCFEQEFDSIYVLNLRGNALGSGEYRKKESGNVFGGGTRTSIAITFLVKNPAHKQEKATIYYHDIGDYLSREDKLRMIKGFKDVEGVEWTVIKPTKKNDWINQRGELFDTLIPITPKKKFDNKAQSFFSTNVIGVATNRDAWDYGFSESVISENIKELLSFYNKQRLEKENGKISEYSHDETKIKWTRALRRMADNNVELKYSKDYFVTSLYRPFSNMHLYYDRALVESPGQWDKIFPTKRTENRVICVNGVGGSKDFMPLMIDSIPNLHVVENGQEFPLYWYEENKNAQMTLFDGIGGNSNQYIRHDGITDWILAEARKRYHTKDISKEHIFYYVYGLLHSHDYRERFAADLKKSLPRIPLVERVEDFITFYKAGKKLADLHLNYEQQPPCPGLDVKSERPAQGDESDYEYFRIVDKMRFRSKQDKSTIIYNPHITINDIPEKAYQYVVNGKSAIEWIMERYCVSVDKASRIKNDCNDWALEHHNPTYIFNLLLSVINVSVQSVDIIQSLPRLKF